MKKLLSKIFLTVFFVLSSVAGFLIALSSSYGDAPVSGTLTLSETIECGYWDYSEEVPFTIKVGNKVGNESRGYFTFFFAAEESTYVYVSVKGYDNCEDCYVTTYCTNCYGAEWNLGSQNGCYVTTTSSGVNEIQLIFGITPSYYHSAYWSGYCTYCYTPPINIKYRIYDLYNSYDEEFVLSSGLEKDVSFLSAAPDGDMVQYRFSGEEGDSIVVNATITNYGNISEEKWEKPSIILQKINYNADGIVASLERRAASDGILTDTLSVSGDYYVTVYTPSYNGYPSRNTEGCNSVSGSVPVHISITSTSNALVVNTTGDEPDADLTDGVCDANLSSDGNQCTLRAAIQEANKREGEDTITFESSVSSISPEKSLPDITETVTIDASSNSSSVEVNGSNAGKNTDGFSVTKGNLTLKNLTVSGFSGNGVKSDGNGDVTLKNVTIRKNGNDGIRTRGYVQLSEVEVTDNKAYGVFAKNDIVISGTETAVSKFSENGKIGLYSQTGNVAANEATLQVENNGDAGIAAENGDVSINFMTDKPAYYGRQSTIKGNGKSGIIANGGRRTNNNDEDTKIGNVRASNIVVEGNGAKIKGKITPKPSQRNGGHGINASGYVQLIEARVVDNKGYGISSKYDVAISGSETATNEFKNNGGAGIYCQLGNIAARDVIISVEENGRFGIGADKGGVFLNDATVINNKGIGIVVGGDLSINKGKVCDNNGGDIKVKGQESLGEDVVVCDRENQ